MKQTLRPKLLAKHFADEDSYFAFARGYLGVLRKSRQQDKNDLHQFISFAMTRARRSKAQFFQDLWALWETHPDQGGYFVEFGAGDGMSLSNTYLLEKSFGWTGVVAEPNPAFIPLVRNVRSCYVSDKCLYPRSGEEIAFLSVPVGELSRIRDIVPKDPLEINGSRASADTREVLVKTISLNDLLTEADAPPKIDFMSLDTEGSEFEILAAFDFARWQVNAICVEHNYTPLRADINALLTSHGYRRKFEAFSGIDDWYVLDHS